MNINTPVAATVAAQPTSAAATPLRDRITSEYQTTFPITAHLQGPGQRFSAPVEADVAIGPADGFASSRDAILGAREFQQTNYVGGRGRGFAIVNADERYVPLELRHDLSFDVRLRVLNKTNEYTEMADSYTTKDPKIAGVLDGHGNQVPRAEEKLGLLARLRQGGDRPGYIGRFPLL